ncbi:MAG: DNA gyrase/topoisomerase IV subunit A [Saprospiraceae bacterium]
MEENGQNTTEEKVISLKGMYKDYFLDYASYVILERAVPMVDDGLKPVQRRIFHAMKQMDDGRFHKVANIIGQTMQYHPHGDAAIGGALVGLGQKNLMIDCQGNWGDTRTGDGAAAARYIEARLTKFGLEIMFNAKTTNWQLSYDGRKKEPIALPAKFPLLLAQGVEGIAVGLSTKIMPHNFIELIKASIDILRGKKVKLYPDFETGGMVDVTSYNDGKRGGKIRVRARMEEVDKKTIAIRELPYGVTTSNLMDSIVKANDKGKIKIKKVVDNTAADVEILVELGTNVSPSLTMDALYAFTNCEISISPNACVIIDDKPHFLSVTEILKICTEKTKGLLKLELEIERNELEEKWHFASLEKIFIQKRIYRDIEECETWEEVITTIHKGLKPYIQHLKREVTDDDIVRLTEIKIKRISKYNEFQADEKIRALEERLDEIAHNLANLTEFTIDYYKNLLKKYGKGRERKTEIKSFDVIQATAVVANNTKLYIDRKGGFIGSGLKKEEFVTECSDIDNIIVFLKSGKYKVTKIADKTFIGKGIIHVAVWKKGDERTTYNAIYSDGKTGKTFVKRFNVKATTRDREYDITQGNPHSKLLYFTANPNGESEIVKVQLTQSSSAKIKSFEYDFTDLAIKGRGSRGNVLTKYPVYKVKQERVGKSTLGALKVYIDEVSGRLNTGGHGKLLGAFDTGEQILVLWNDGTYEVRDFEVNEKLDLSSIVDITKYTRKLVISGVYYDPDREATYVKRFKVETASSDKKYNYLSSDNAKFLFATLKTNAVIKYAMRVGRKKMNGEINLDEFIDIKGWKALGNKFSDKKLYQIELIKFDEPKEEEQKKTLNVGDSVGSDGKKTLFD